MVTDLSKTSLPRLNKYLALTMGTSRREADSLVEQGHVKFNGEPAELWQRVGPDDVVTVDGKLLGTEKSGHVYFAFNKPVGYVTSRRQQGDSPTIYDLIPQEFHHLKPVGRLDRDSSGLLLLTNDGDFAHSMTHPSFRKTKRYEVVLDRPLQPLHMQMISDHGVALPDGVSKFTVTSLDHGYEVTMSEGRNRQIRRTFAALGYTVTELYRTDFGPFSVAGIKAGTWKDLGRIN